MAAPLAHEYSGNALIQLLDRGNEQVVQLRRRLLETPGIRLRELSLALLDDISRHLDRATSLLKKNAVETPRRREQAAAGRSIVSPPCGNKNKGPSPKRKRPETASGGDDHKRRGSIKITSAPLYDGYQWRKYGQKMIHGFEYPRSYYRCTYGTDQGCPALKWVQQRDNDNPPKFLVTSFHGHTCKIGHTVPTVVQEPPLPPRFTLINFRVPESCTAVPSPQHPSSLETREDLRGTEIRRSGSSAEASPIEVRDGTRSTVPSQMMTTTAAGVAEAPPASAPPGLESLELGDLEQLLEFFQDGDPNLIEMSSDP